MKRLNYSILLGLRLETYSMFYLQNSFACIVSLSARRRVIVAVWFISLKQIKKYHLIQKFVNVHVLHVFCTFIYKADNVIHIYDDQRCFDHNCENPGQELWILTFGVTLKY